MIADHKMRSFVGFIVYAENSVKNYTNGRFVPEDLPAGVEVVNCSTLQVSEIKAASEVPSELKCYLSSECVLQNVA